jgi:hypothetical protein
MGTREKMALAFATLLTAGSLLLAPSWSHPLVDVCHVAGILALVTVAILWGAFAFAEDVRAVIEQFAAALFLVGMPVVYIVAWLQVSDGSTVNWLLIEMAGFPLYAALAVLGLWKSPWFLVIGIAGHGLGWDAWHYFSSTPYIPHWYAIGCLLADIGLSVYFAARIPAWRALKY